MIKFCVNLKHTITNTNELFYAGAVVVTNRLGVRLNKAAKRKKPMRWRCFQNKIKQLWKDLSRLESSKDKEVSNLKHWHTERKYSITVIALAATIEELRQRIIAIPEKVRKYQERADWFKQNRMFQDNQMQFYGELNQEGEICHDDQPDVGESKTSLGNIWSELVDHTRDVNG